MKSRFTLLPLLFLCIILLSGCANTQKPGNSNLSQANASSNISIQSQPQSIHPWPMFHGNFNHNGYVNISGPPSATLKWKFFAGNIQGHAPNSIAISNDGTIFLTGADKIFALDNNGNEKWSEQYTNSQGPAIAEDGTICFASENSIIALNSNGTEKWRFTTNGRTIFGPTIGPDGTIYQGSWDSYLYAINLNGSLRWKYKTKGAVSYPATIDSNGIIYLGGGDAHAGPDSNIYAFNNKGELIWTYDTGVTRVGSPAIGFDSLIYFPAAPFIFVLDSTGIVKWEHGPAGQGDISGIISPAITPDGILYVGTSQGIVNAIDTKTTEIKWTFKTNAAKGQANFYGLPTFPIVDKDDTVYMGSVDGNMYAIDKTGNLKWKYQTGDKLTEAAPAIGPDGTLYFSSEDGYLYAIH